MPSAGQRRAHQPLHAGQHVDIHGDLDSITVRFVDELDTSNGATSYLIDYDLGAGCVFLTVLPDAGIDRIVDAALSLPLSDPAVANVIRTIRPYVGRTSSAAEIFARCEQHTTSRLRAALSAAAPDPDGSPQGAGDPTGRVKRLRRISQILLEAERTATQLRLSGSPSTAMEDLSELVQRSQAAEANALAEIQIAILQTQQEIAELATKAEAREREKSTRHEQRVAFLTYVAVCLAVPVLVVNTIAAAPPPNREWNVLLIVCLTSAITAAVVFSLRGRGTTRVKDPHSNRGTTLRPTLALAMIAVVLVFILYKA